MKKKINKQNTETQKAGNYSQNDYHIAICVFYLNYTREISFQLHFTQTFYSTPLYSKRVLN